MASSGKEEVRVPIGIPVETNAKEAATDVEGLADSITASKDRIKDLASAMRNLRGKTDEVKAAKDQLKEALRKEEEAVTAASLKLIKQGGSYDKLAEKAKALAKSQDKLKAQQEKDAKKGTDDHAKKLAKGADEWKKKNAEAAKTVSSAFRAAGGPIGGVADRLGALADVAGGANGKLGALTMVTAGATAAVVALAAAAVAGVVALAAWAIKGADAARSLNLVRVAATGSAANAEALGTQIDALAKKVPTSTEKLNELASSLARSRLGGQVTVDTLNAVAQASAAIDDSAGSKLREIVERGRLANRMYLGLLELQGTGLDFDDVASSLADAMHVGIKDARRALMEGRVKLGDGAKAIRDAVEKKFGGVNLQKMMSLEGLAETLGKKFRAMTSGINLEPAARAASKFLQVFDESTATGAVLKRAVTAFGDGISKVLERGAPIAREFIRGLIIGGLQIYVQYLKVRNTIRDAFGGTDLLKNVDLLSAALTAGKIAIGAFVGAALVLGGAVAVAVAPFYLAVYKIGQFVSSLANAYDYCKSLTWDTLGTAIVDGLINGLLGGGERVRTVVKDLAGKVKDGFKDALGIHSPSRVFAKFGEHTAEGYQQGVEAGTGGAQRSVAELGAVPSPARGGALAGAGGGASVTLHVGQLVIQGSAGGPIEALRSPGVVEELTRLLKEAAAAAGLVPA